MFKAIYPHDIYERYTQVRSIVVVDFSPETDRNKELEEFPALTFTILGGKYLKLHKDIHGIDRA